MTRKKQPKPNNPALLILLLALLLGACSNRPAMVLGQEKMARLLVDLELAEAYATDQRLGELSTDSARLELRRAILAKHHTNEATLDSSLNWYGRNLPLYLDVLERADSILSDSLRILQAEEQLALTKAAGDSTEIWPLSPSAIFAQNQASDFLTFEVETDSTWKRGDVVTLNLSVHNNLSKINASLLVDYANRGKTTDGLSASLYPGDENRLTLKLQLDSTLSARRIYGFIHLTPTAGERAFADSIRLTRTRMVTNDYNHLRRIQRRIRRHAL